MRVIIDHMAGSRRGQRQTFEAGQRLRFGRHPECEVSFDAHRDLDASSRHAELVWSDGSATLLDIGSSNGTMVEGQRISDCAIAADEPCVVEFGKGGPRLRLILTEAAEVPLPEGMPRPRSRRILWLVLAVLLGCVGGVVALLTR